MSARLPPGAEPFLRSEDGGPDLPRVGAIMTALTAEFGGDYAMTFARAIEFANHDQQVRYLLELAAAERILTRAGRSSEQSHTIALAHVKSVHAAIGEDLQAHVDNGGILPPRRPTGTR